MINQIIYKRVYEVMDSGMSYWILVLFNISGYHYVGLKVHSSSTPSSILLSSINKHVDLFGIREYTRSMIKRCIYEKNRPLEVSDDEFVTLFEKCKGSLLGYLDKSIPANTDGITYLKWCKDKYILNRNDTLVTFALRQNAIYWVNMGYGVGSEIRKIRPAILWRSTNDRKMWTIIPLTTKAKNDEYYFHYDLTTVQNSTAKIEGLVQISVKRILSPYYKKNLLAFISQDEKEDIKRIIKRYYCFE